MNRALLLSALAFSGLAACGGPIKYSLPATQRAPGADAQLVAEIKQEQHLTMVEFKATNLPPPTRIVEGASQFIAWHRSGSEKAWSRTGSLQYDDDARAGQLTASVPEVAFDFEVTVEKVGEPGTPAAEVIFAKRVAKP